MIHQSAEIIKAVRQGRCNNAQNQQAARAEIRCARRNNPVHTQVAFQLSRLMSEMPFAVEIAHDHAEKAVSGHGGEHTRNRVADTVLEHIENVLRGGKSKRYEHRIYHTVKQAVEAFALMGEQERKQPLAALFDQGDNDKGIKQIIEKLRDTAGKIRRFITAEHAEKQRVQARMQQHL